MKKDKLKMSNRVFRRILVPIMAVLLVITLIANIAAVILPSTLDTYVGKGKDYIELAKGTENWDTDYYKTLFTNNDESTAGAYEVAQRVAEEGSILLKNNGILPLAKESTVMPFGRAYLAPSYGQETSGGSAKWVVDPVTPEEGLASFTINSSAADLMKASPDPVGLLEAEGTLAAGDAATVLGGDCKIYEYDPAIYDDLEPASDTTGIVFITRLGQEGQDQKYDAYEDGTPHYLALSENEKGAIHAAKETCGSVVVILVTSAAMEMAPLLSGDLEADAILWVGHPGERGFNTLSSLLDGDVNPSGRTVDIYATDFTKDPSYQNIGAFTYSNANFTKAGFTSGSGKEISRMFTDYQEGMYMGYRYYETADAVDDAFVYGELDNQGSILSEGAVCYPFGYGLSYTSFQQELMSLTQQDGTVTATVKVTNTGAVAGKDVVQLYYTAPYTELDQENKIEKPIVNLIEFDKTELLEPGKSETLTLEFDMEDMVSYSYVHENPNGTIGCYMLEEGDYIISLRKNSHEVIAENTVTQPETIWYDGSDEKHIRKSEILAQSALDNEGNSLGYPASKEADENAQYIAASNQFQVSSDYMNKNSSILSRTNWSGTQPKTAENRSKELQEEFAVLMNKEITFDVNTDEEFGNVEGSLVYAAKAPISKADNGLVLADLRGLSYNDEKWELLLDQIDWEADKDGILMNFSGAAYVTGKVDSIGLPSSEEYDGANGLKVKGADNGYDMTKSSSFGFAPLIAATWNEELLYEVGAAFGQESLQNDINGWYCPAINLHRSPFSGRVFEYYSEDPVLSGRLAARIISGAGDQGMFCYVKHFALNETETGRAELGAYWADEQTMRELYLKAFEIAIEEATMTINYTSDDEGTVTTKTMRAATAVMAAQNSVGTIVGECNYALLNNVLRKEWGFQGMVVSDYWVWGENNLRDLAIRTGCDTYLCMYMPAMWGLTDYDSATARSTMRNALHNISYTIVNSNAMQGMAPGAIVKTTMSSWMKLLVVFDVLMVLLIGGGVFWIIRRTKLEKAHPELYKRKEKKDRRIKS
jgi:beta-glucosidase